jgi:hypothetical protein
MQKTSILFTLAASALVMTMSCSQESKEAVTPKAPTPEEVVKRGEYLVGIMGCNDCHSPKRMGPKGPENIPELMLSGFPGDSTIGKFDTKIIKDGYSVFYPGLTAAAGPWGVSFAANLTPDETGIGNWTEEQFKKAIKEGKYKGIDGTRPLLPPMPWGNYAQLSDEDAHAMFMYLKSIKPVKNIVPMPIAPDKM